MSLDEVLVTVGTREGEGAECEVQLSIRNLLEAVVRQVDGNTARGKDHWRISQRVERLTCDSHS